MGYNLTAALQPAPPFSKFITPFKGKPNGFKTATECMNTTIISSPQMKALMTPLPLNPVEASIVIWIGSFTDIAKEMCHGIEHEWCVHWLKGYLDTSCDFAEFVTQPDSWVEAAVLCVQSWRAMQP